jgi:mannose-6-phosphate isomerase
MAQKTEINEILKMKNSIQPYAWGSTRMLADFLEDPNLAGSPQAELWMGAHPKAPSKVWLDNRWQDLDRVIADRPVEMLGPQAGPRFNNTLPYLFKVLAADEPLSIQAHPSKRQAQEGFKREADLGIPLSAGHRNYKDPNHKPECICALTPFWGVCGFRPASQMLPLLKAVWPSGDQETGELLSRLENDNELFAFFKGLMTLSAESQEYLLNQILSAATPLAESHAVFQWVQRLNERYPMDIGILSPILLNLFCLQPEEALFLPAGQLHAYLGGMGIEIMANSDNVLRGGLTPKHVDVNELLNVLQFETLTPELMKPMVFGVSEFSYPSMAEEFILSKLIVSDALPYHHTASPYQSAEILLCTVGEAIIGSGEGRHEIRLSKGQSGFVPASVNSYSIFGQATLYRASINATMLVGSPSDFNTEEE